MYKTAQPYENEFSDLEEITHTTKLNTEIIRNGRQQQQFVYTVTIMLDGALSLSLSLYLSLASIHFQQ